MVESDGINKILSITFLHRCGLDGLCINTSNGCVVIKDLANTFTITDFEDCGFCGFDKGVIDDFHLCCKAAHPFRNNNTTVAQCDAIAQGDIRPIEIVGHIDCVGGIPSGRTRHRKTKTGCCWCFVIEGDGVLQIIPISLEN